jgi:NAD(P)-dependent dehydrogenase (short-subunit alcohol dehydrogenase family)
VAYLSPRERADVAITYLPAERNDAEETRKAVEETGRRCLLVEGDLTDEAFCRAAVERTVRDLGRLDVLVSNAAHQNRKTSLEEVTSEEWERTFRTNVFAYFHLVKAALPHMKPGSAIIATSSETAHGHEALPDYSATKGAIETFTKSLARMLTEKGVRANAVAPGPVWTPLNPADEGLPPEGVAKFGEKGPLERPAQPEEIAPAYVFLASDADSSFISGVILPALGGITF